MRLKIRENGPGAREQDLDFNKHYIFLAGSGSFSTVAWWVSQAWAVSKVNNFVLKSIVCIYLILLIIVALADYNRG